MLNMAAYPGYPRRSLTRGADSQACRQVSWLPDIGASPPSHPPEADSGAMAKRPPVTVARPQRFFTAFPVSSDLDKTTLEHRAGARLNRTIPDSNGPKQGVNRTADQIQVIIALAFLTRLPSGGSASGGNSRALRPSTLIPRGGAGHCLPGQERSATGIRTSATT